MKPVRANYLVYACRRRAHLGTTTEGGNGSALTAFKSEGCGTKHPRPGRRGGSDRQLPEF